MFLGFDPLYFLILAPGLLLGAWAQWRIHSAYQEASQYPSFSGITGAQAAYQVMLSGNVHGVGIEPTHGMLSDHYDPNAKVLRLSEGVYGSDSLAALGIAAHEAGHAIQDAEHYGPLVLRNLLVPAANIGSTAGWIVLALGMALQMAGLIWLGILVFSATVVFQLVNLPVEFDASRRARAQLLATGLVHPEHDAVVARVLNAAALTYVAATLTSILTLLYYVLRSGILGRRDD